MKPHARTHALAAAALLTACGERLPDLSQQDRGTGIASLHVTAQGNRGTPRAPLDFSTRGETFTLRVEARGRDHAVLTGFNGYVGLSVNPGLVLGIQGPNTLGNYVRLTRGVAENVRMTIARGYGEARIWAEDSGYLPVDPRGSTPPGCANGRDDDGDGRVDYPADQGCAASNDDSETAGSYVVGTSEPIFFNSPLLSDVQGRTAVSPLQGERITVTRGRLIITRINNSGFFVTDVADTSCMGQPCYNHIFAFNFRTPEGLRPCDTIDVLQGSVTEFVGYTELNQPGFHVSVLWRPNDPAVGACPIPDPVPLTATILGPVTEFNDPELEKFEAGLVRATNVAFPTRMGPNRPTGDTPQDGATNCDFNGDGRITYDRGREQLCADACAADPACSEWSTWARFGQILVTVEVPARGAPSRVAVAPRDILPGFNPLARNPNATITGTLRQVGPNWIIEPRCEADIAFGNTNVRPPRETCLHERSEREE